MKKEFNKLKTNFNIVSLGKLSVLMIDIKRIKIKGEI